MTPLLMLLSACFSDITHRQGCDELRAADIKYYKIDKLSDKAKELAETQFGRNLVVTTGTIGYTIYKQRIDYSFSRYNFKLTNNEGSASIKWSL